MRAQKSMTQQAALVQLHEREEESTACFGEWAE